MKYLIKAIFIYLFFCLPTLVFAQQKLDTIFYDEYWRETSIRDSVHFYRIPTKLENNFKVEDYYVSNKIQMIGYVVSLHQDSKTGHFQYFHENGNLSSEGNFEFNEREGTWKFYYENGKIWYQTFYFNGLMNGELKSFYRSGELKRKAKFKNNVMVSEKCYDSKIDNSDFMPIITYPSFVGGEEEMNLYLANNVTYPQKAKDNNIEGRVVLKFWIETNGYIDSITVLSKPKPFLDEELIRVIRKMPSWVPGKADCQDQKLSYILPFVF
ncbi:MAG: TonB family protein [Bacteroidia bacterium]|nr:TonB family protein [Bacteroidia bacterium]